MSEAGTSSSSAGLADSLVPDAGFPWPGGNAYDTLSKRLAAVGSAELTPRSTMREVQDAFFDLQGKATPEVRKAWDQLRRAGPRLLADFCLYRAPGLDATAIERVARELPMPVHVPDPVGLIELPALGTAIIAARVELQPVATAEIAAAALAAAIEAPFVASAPELADVIGDLDE